MKDFLSYFGARKYKNNQGYSTEWMVKKSSKCKEDKVLGLLKVWVHSSREGECTKGKIKKLNKMMDNEVLATLKAMEEPPVLRKMGDKQLNVWVKLLTTDTHKMFCKQALINSGSSSSCIN